MIYLDAAATTLEKPPQVRQAMAQAAAELSTPPLIPKNTCAIEASYASMHIPDRIMSNKYAKWY